MAVLSALACAGCSYQLESMFSKTDDDASATASVGHPATQLSARGAVQISEADLIYARAAAADVLSRGSDANSVPWRNPETGVGGNITPLAASNSGDGLPCRDFLASYTSSGSQSWLQGWACRTSAGEWQVKSLKPLKSS
jgi:surface antigen